MKILISGYYGFGNVGDEAVLVAILQGLRQHVPGVEITVLSSQPKLTAELNKVKSIYRYHPFKIFMELLQSDVFLSGGGTLFQDVTSKHSFWYYLGLVWLAKLFGKKVMVMAQGFGPLSNGLNRWLAKVVLNKVDLITLRDDDSRLELVKIGVNRPPVSVTADPTFTLAEIDRSVGRKVLALEGIPLHKKLIGVAVRDLLPKNRIADKLFHDLAVRLDELSKKNGYQIVFLLFQCPEDMSAAAKVIKQMSERAEVIFRICRPDEMLSLFSQFELVVGFRLHSLIFAAMNQVPMLGISYDPKVTAFMQAIGQPCLEVKDFGQLEPSLSKVIAEREAIRQGLKRSQNDQARKAELNFNLFAEKFGPGVS